MRLSLPFFSTLRPYSVLLSGLLFSSALTAQQHDPGEIFLQDLQRQRHQDSYEVLSAEQRQMAIMISEPTVPLTRGVAVLVSDVSRYPDSPFSLSPLVRDLNNWGWVTMQMPAPEQAFHTVAVAEQPAPPATDNAASNNDQPSAQSQDNQLQPRAVSGPDWLSMESFTAQQQHLKAQLDAIVARSQQYPGFFLIIAQGTSAAWLAKLYAEEQLETPDALIVVSPYWPDREHNNRLPQLLADTPMPVLDLYNPFDNKWSQATREQRQISATKSLKLQYRQRELIGQSLDSQQYAFMAKEIYGWLTHLGW